MLQDQKFSLCKTSYTNSKKQTPVADPGLPEEGGQIMANAVSGSAGWRPPSGAQWPPWMESGGSPSEAEKLLSIFIQKRGQKV